MIKHLWKNQEGAVVVIAGLLLTVLLGFVGLALDLGNLVVTKTRMQNAVDAAVLGGGLLLPSNGQPTRDRANSFITANNFTPVDGQPTFDQDTVLNPTNRPEINYSMTNNVNTYFMGLFGYPSVPITVSAKAILPPSNPDPAFNYAIFSGSPTLVSTLNEAVLTVRGSVHSNDILTINGASINISGSAEAVNQVNVHAASTHIGQIVNNASNIPMPDYSQQIADIAGTTYSSDQTFSGAITQLSNSISVQGNVTLSGATVNSTGAILATGNINLNGAGVTVNGSNQVCLYSSNGNINVNAASFANSGASAILMAPHGTITINTASTTFQGVIIGNQVNVNAASATFDSTNFSPTSLPSGNHVKLIK